MFQYRFILGNKYTTLVGDDNDGESYACVGMGVYGKSVGHPFNFTVNLKLLIKKSLKQNRSERLKSWRSS